MRADFLLNFQRPPAQRPAPASYSSGHRQRNSAGHRRTAPASFAKGRFVQSSFRLFVDAVTADVAEAAFSADAMLDWNSVRRVDLLCEEHPRCPICLEEAMVVPKVTRCGHVYCAPCVLRYHMVLEAYNGKVWQRCPVCNDMITCEDLTSVRFQMVKPLREGDQLDFVLAQRDADATAVRLKANDVEGDDADGEAVVEADEVEAGLHLPRERDRGWHLGRLLRLAPGEADRILAHEIEALKAYRPVAISAGDTELLPSIDAAVALLSSRREHRRGGRDASDRVREQGGGLAGISWGCQYVEAPDVLSGSRGSERGAPGRGGSARGSSSAAASTVASPDVAATAPRTLSADSEGDLQLLAADMVPELAPDGGNSGRREDVEPGAAPGRSPLAPGDGASAAPAPGRSPALAPADAAAGGAAGGGGSRSISHYQLADGRLVFLNPFFTRLLLHEHGGRWDRLPAALIGLRLDRAEEHSVQEDLRKRHRFLSHMPLGSQVTFCDVDLRGRLSRETKEYFGEEFAKRRLQRKREELKEKKEDRLSKSRAAVEEEKYYRSLNLMHHGAVVQAPPTKDDFALDLHGRHSVEEEVEAATATGEGDAPNGGRLEGEALAEGHGPTLAELMKWGKGKLKGRGKAKREAGPAAPDLSGEDLFPSLGGATSGSAGGRGRGSGKGVGPQKVAAPATPKSPPRVVPDSWDEEVSPCASAAGAAVAEPSFGAFGAALEASQTARTASTPPAPAAEGAAASEGAEAETSAKEDVLEPVAADVGAGGEASKSRKKGRAGKVTTLRLFG